MRTREAVLCLVSVVSISCSSFLFSNTWAAAIHCQLTDDPFNNPCNGTEGSDTIIGAKGSNVINGLGGSDNIVGGVGLNEIDGGDGNDLVKGSTGDDRLVGGNGDDLLIGGDGNDFLRGGKGKDNFVCGRGVDTAIDFNPQEGDKQSSCEFGTLIIKLNVINDNGGLAKPSDFRILIYLGDSSIDHPNYSFLGSSEGTSTVIPTDFGIHVFFQCDNLDKCANYPTSPPEGDPGDEPEGNEVCDNDPLHIKEVRTCVITANDPEN
jgi:RTX calcium-binding nonapeptide repeat (4 copies)